MHKLLSICFFFLLLGQNSKSQQPAISVSLIKKEADVLPGEIINLPFFIKNNSAETATLKTEITAPEKWNIILKSKTTDIKPTSQNFSVVTLQIPNGYPVGNYPVSVQVFNQDNKLLASEKLNVAVNEVEKIDLQLIEVPNYILAGDSLKAKFLLQNQGNVEEKIFIETGNCEVIGNNERKLHPGESIQFTIFKTTSSELPEARKEYITVRAIINENSVASIYRTVVVFPSKNNKKDLFHRLPVSLSSTFISTNQRDKFQSAWQLELYGSGTLDPQQQHNLEFLARGPNNSNLGFLGMYSQYYISYGNKNMEVFLGEKAYSFTPLTESSRFGAGAEGKLMLDNGLFAGLLYVKPRFFNEIENEYAVYTGFEKDRNNSISAWYIQKRDELTQQSTYLGSVNSSFQPFKKTQVDLEISRGTYNGTSDNAYRTNINTQFSIFRLAGNYFHTGKNYPGYFSNSTFYSGNFSANITSKLSLGVYAREDFLNAELDTFFIYAPYSKSYQTILNYNFAPRSYLKFYWRESERKDRLVLDKFHYKTRSLNAQLNQKVKKFDYDIFGEIGNTTNYLIQAGTNEQRTYRASLNLGYRINSRNAFRAFGSWSNINSFVSGEQRNVTAGMSVVTRLHKNISANFHLQNAYNIEDYYRNRNLMQLNVDYKFLKQHKFTLRSFYTLFRRQTENPEFTFSATYTYNFGFPVKRLMKAGDLSGRVTNDADEPVEGVIISMLNKSAVSDKNGEFSFKSIQPGNHLIIVDRSNFNINETINIPTPIEVSIFEDKVTPLHFKVTEGAKVTGRFTSSDQTSPNSPGKNIIIELADENEQFRISTSPDGTFSFPIVRPGNWRLKIYPNSIPSGFEINQTNFNLQLKPGENMELEIPLLRKKRNIIFKSQNISLSTSSAPKTDPVKPALDNKLKEPKNEGNKNDHIFYTVQVGVFSKKIDPGSTFFKGYKFDHEKKTDQYYIYFIGTFEHRDEAEKAKSELQKTFKGAFVVKFKNNTIVR